MRHVRVVFVAVGSDTGVMTGPHATSCAFVLLGPPGQLLHSVLCWIGFPCV